MSADSSSSSTEKVIFRIYTEETDALKDLGLASSFRTLVGTREVTAQEVRDNFVKNISKGLESDVVKKIESCCETLYLVSEDGKTTAEFKPDSKLWPVLQSLPKVVGQKLLCSCSQVRAKGGSITITKKNLSAFSQMCQGPIFDMPLSVIMADQGSGYLPWLVEKCIAYLSVHLDTEGLFRVSGSQAEVQLISEAFDRGEDVSLENMTDDPHVVASTLVLFVSCLPEPLLTFANYKNFIALKDADDRVKHAGALCDALPEHNYAVLEVLCQFLKQVARHSDKNKMTTKNLANVFGPVALYCEDDRGKSVLGEIMSIIEVFETLIDNADEIFGITTLKNDITSLYEVEQELGTGAFAVVKVVRQKSTNTEYAAKFIEKAQLASEDKKMLEREVAILKRLRHPNIISLKAVCETEKHLILITELARGGELFDRIHDLGAHAESDVVKIARQLISAIGYLHSKGIAHRDLKPENILLRDKEGLVIKLADFGLGRIIDPGVAMSTMCGTPSYVAPEVLLGEKYTLQVDMWSVGVIVYILLSGRMPFFGKKMQDLAERIITGKYAFPEERWSHISKSAKAFVSALLQTDPSVRLTPKQAYMHPFLRTQSPSTVQLRLDALEHRENVRGERSGSGSSSGASTSSASTTAAKPASASSKPAANEKKKPHRFSAKTYHKPTWCDHCGEFLWGVYRQGQHCKKCLANVHKQCIDDYSKSEGCGEPKRGRQALKDSGRKRNKSPKRKSKN
eukprot:CAMPEP_0201544394 /NCGR_PEP_ID=MMETSP0173_2-20130828/1000_1 /ASSEMBLY_ACC=CAM_ASM_000268 /TAXON_ID=218659 /ORGANISM="Vexillifera sp., Strain DIVA3 564/2" /LENGTH=739 /DNA_ID=CAMNT_0047952489 /DNA_START=9 /DNA_END=2228 /DNA_ORIENTATION=+